MRILLIEDEVHLSEAVVHILKQNNYTVDAVYNGMDGYDYLLSGIYDIAILDVMLPKMNGFEVLKQARDNNIDTPIIMLTARSQLEDKVYGLTKGADDYLTKPFQMEELLARLKALGRRKGKTMEKELMTFGDISFDKETLKMTSNTKEVFLTHLESELFELLYNRKNMITSKEAIIVKLWGYDSDVEDNNVEVYVSFLRKKLRYVSNKVSIKTTRRVGYSLEVSDNV